MNNTDGRRTLWMMRHGALDAEYDGRLVGSLDLPLSEKGRADARNAAGFIASLGRFDHVAASPKLRVRQTVELALASEILHTVNYDPLLRETDFGHWEGLTIAETAEHDKTAFELWRSGAEDFAFPGGESMSEFSGRIAAIREKLISCEAENMLLITHGGIILGLICAFLGLPRNKMAAMKVERGALCRIDVFSGGLGMLTALNIKPGEFSGNRGEK